MKKIKFLLALTAVIMGLIVAQSASAQIVSRNSDSSLVISAYAGILNTTSLSIQGANITNSHDIRLGGRFYWEALSWMKVKSFVAYGRSNGKDLAFNSFAIDIHSRNEKFGIEFGHGPTPSAESRPIPVSGDGQFETWTEGRLPGVALGAKIYLVAGAGKISTGVGIRNKKPEYHVRYSTKIFDYGMSYGTNAQKFQTFVVARLGRIYSISVFENEKPKNLPGSNLVANFTNVKISKAENIDFYFDCGYRINTKKFERLEFGLIKNFEVSVTKGLIALGYQYETKSINAYLLLYLNSPKK